MAKQPPRPRRWALFWGFTLPLVAIIAGTWPVSKHFILPAPMFVLSMFGEVGHTLADLMGAFSILAILVGIPVAIVTAIVLLVYLASEMAKEPPQRFK